MPMQVEEVGPRTDHDGPCLAAFWGSQVEPSDVLAWMEDSINSHIRRSIMRVFFFPASAKSYSSRQVQEGPTGCRLSGVQAGLTGMPQQHIECTQPHQYP